MNNNRSMIIGFCFIALVALFFVVPEYFRYQTRQTAQNQVAINEIRIHQQEQLKEVERQLAQIRIIEAGGIAEAQKLINATLTDKYLQHEAIKAQERMANGPNHSTVYIPSGQNGIPLVKTLDDNLKESK